MFKLFLLLMSFNLYSNCSDILTVTTIGKSVSGVDIQMYELSDNINDSRPNILYVGNIHGDETAGKGILELFINDICLHKSEHLEMLHNVNIFIIPTINPDGFIMKKRYNKNGKDLNRDFPKLYERNTTNGRQVETIILMELYERYKFDLSVCFHGGAEVVNYPWDSKKELPNDVQRIIDISKGFTELVPRLNNSVEFKNGITNGYAWYAIYGGFQDWSYYFYDSLQLTIELTNDKLINERQFPELYKEYKKALIYLIGEKI